MANALRLLIAHGVNLDLLGRREPHVYGHRTLQDLELELRKERGRMLKETGMPRFELAFFQSNAENLFLEELSRHGWDGIVLNPGAWTHTSLALADRLKGLTIPYVEVHLSNIQAREDVRRHSYTAANAVGVVTGFGFTSYVLGMRGLIASITAQEGRLG